MKYGVTMKATVTAMLGLGLLCANVYAQDTSQTVLIGQPQASSPEQNKLAGQAFLAENKKRPNVKTLPDGLQYVEVIKGTGPRPTENDTVTVDYKGTLINGTEFDSSYKRGEPASFQVNAVIPGWVEALKLMPVGSTWKLFIPSDLAYGEQGAPPLIGPNEALIFEVKLISIQK